MGGGAHRQNFIIKTEKIMSTNTLKRSRSRAFVASMTTAAMLLGSAFFAPQVGAHTDPAGCDSTGVSLSFTVYRADGTTPVGGGTVAVGETIKYKATLSHAGGTNCNYGGGDLDIITPDGVNHDVDSGTIPLISSGSPFMGTVISYVVSSSDIGGDADIDASAVYSGGTSHLGTENVTPVGATTPAANAVTSKIIVIKQTTPDGSSQSFTFDTNYGDNFSLTDGQQNDSGQLVPGTYSIDELSATGWDETSATCNDGSPITAINLSAGETVTCTFMNTQQMGHIIVNKVTDPAGSTQSFAFTTTGSGYSGFSLTDAATPNDQALVAGTYSVAETAVTGWDQTSAVCISSTQDVETPGNLDLDAGETITCTFTNTLQMGHIIVDKVTNPAGSTQSFAFTTTGSGYTGFSLTSGATPNDQALNAGTYSVSETATTGWDQTSATCVSSNQDTETPGNLDLDAGETITCTFTNTEIVAVQGCSPGYWKQPQHFGTYPTGSPYNVYPNTLFVTVFGENAFPGMTLLQVLSQGGGGLNALGRHIVGAYLNAATVEGFPYTPEEVIADFQSAYPGGDYSSITAKYEALQDPCPFGRNPGPAGPGQPDAIKPGKNNQSNKA